MGDQSTLPVPRGVGLSDPKQSESRRRILGIIDRMRATGWVVSTVPLLRLVLIFLQSWGGYGPPHDRGYWFSKCWKVFLD